MMLIKLKEVQVGSEARGILNKVFFDLQTKILTTMSALMIIFFVLAIIFILVMLFVSAIELRDIRRIQKQYE